MTVDVYGGWATVVLAKGDKTGERTFNEKEFTALLKRAAELQSGADTRGELTLRDVEQIAEAAGIDAQYVRQAAANLESRAEPRFRVFGPAARVQVTGSEQGLLDKSQLSDLLEEVRRVTGRQGVVKDVLDALEWRAAGPMGATYVTVRQRNDEVRVTVLSNRFDAKVTTYLISGVGGLLVGAGLGALLNDLAGGGGIGAPVLFGILNSSLLAGLVAGRSIWSAAARHFRAQVERLHSAAMLHAGKAPETTPPSTRSTDRDEQHAKQVPAPPAHP